MSLFRLMFLLMGLGSALAGCSGAPGAGTVADRPDGVVKAGTLTFEVWLEAFRAEALATGILPYTLDLAFADVAPNPDVLERDRRQPELTRPIWSYLAGAVDEGRVARGRRMLERHGAALAVAGRGYGVPPEIIVAIWGMETDYGTFFGGFDVVEALSTLAYDGRRADFARSELLAALRILQNGDVAAGGLAGSWAGAMGHTQFMPTTYLNRAIDADGDGRRDIWGSLPDVFASTANYLAEAGWRGGEPTVEEIALPADFDWELAEVDIRVPTIERRLVEWRTLGIRYADGGALPATERRATVLLPAGNAGPAFLVGANFRALLDYNNATSYALSVAHLAGRLAGDGPFLAAWPVDEPSLTHDDGIELQRLLDELGYAPGPIDGIVGPMTRASVRLFQRDAGRPPDGFPTVALLDQLRRTHALVSGQGGASGTEPL